MNSKQVFETLDDACVRAKAKGWEIIHTTFIYAENKKCCPIGALLVADAEEVHSGETGIDYAREKLGLSDDRITEIWSGVDNVFQDLKNHRLYRVGMLLARKHIKDPN